jgi:hypothetical protein
MAAFGAPNAGNLDEQRRQELLTAGHWIRTMLRINHSVA